jgi:hypothetical protein
VAVPGVVLEGELADDRSGWSISGVGDVNGDGADDLIVGAYRADPGGQLNVGKSYVVFGSTDKIEIPINQLRIASGQRLILDATHLLAISRLNNETLPFTVLDMTRARFERVGTAGLSIAQFTQSELSTGNIHFIHEGSSIAPTYTLCVYPDRFYGVCSTSNITFLGIIPTLLSNTLSVNQGIPVIVTSSDLSATDKNNIPSTLHYQITQITFCHFEALNTLGQITEPNITTFTQQDVLDRRIRFVPDGSTRMPAYLVSVGDQNFFTEPEAAFIRFNFAPVITLRHFVIDQGQGTLITDQMLSATDLETLDINLAFQASNITQGQFEYVNNPGAELVEFPQFSIMQGSIHFVHSGTEALPTFAFSANDGAGAVSIDPRMPTITLNHRPIVRIGSSLSNQRVNQGEAFTVTVDTTIFDELDGELLRFSANLQGGAALGDRGLSFTNNTLSGTLHTLTPVSIEVIASDPRDLTVSTTFDIAIDAIDALSVNTLSVNQGQSVILRSDNLKAQSTEEAVFQASNIQHGQFERLDSVGLLTEAGIVTFTLQEIENRRIRFTHDGSDSPAAYDVALGDGQVFGQAQSAGIFFNKAPVLTVNSEIILDQGSNTNTTYTKITTDLISATDEATALGDLLFEVRDITHGRFAYSSAGFAITEFPQLPVMQGGVAFIHDGSDQTPGFSLRVSDGSIWSDWQTANITLNHHPITTGTLSDQTAIENEPFSFAINKAVFSDADNDTLTFFASFLGGTSFPKEISFNPLTAVLSGTIAEVSRQTIEINAADPRGLVATATFDLESRLSTFNQLKNLWESAGVSLGVLAAVGGFLLWRKKSLEHRQGHQFASLLRKRLSLKYYDFDRFQGDVFKAKINQLLSYIDGEYQGLYSRLSLEDELHFVDCIAQVMENKAGLIKPAGCFSTVMNTLLFFRCKRVNDLDFDCLKSLIPEIAEEAVADWRSGESQWASDWNRLECDERLFGGLCCCKNPVKSEALDGEQALSEPVAAKRDIDSEQNEMDHEEETAGDGLKVL